MANYSGMTFSGFGIDYNPAKELRRPSPGHYALAVWDGDKSLTQADVRAVRVSLACGDRVQMLDERGTAASGQGAANDSSAEYYDLVLSCRVRRGAGLEALLGSLFPGQILTGPLNTTVVDELAAENPLPRETVLDGEIAAGLVGCRHWIVAGPDVRFVAATACPPTHLPVLGISDTELDHIRKVLRRACLTGQDGQFIAPELLFAPRLSDYVELGRRLRAHLDGDPEAVEPEVVLRERRATRGEQAELASAEALTPVGEAAALEARVMSARGNWRPLDLSVFYEWAAIRGLSQPVTLGTTCFPGALKLLAYPGGWYAVLYADHARVGQLVA